MTNPTPGARDDLKLPWRVTGSYPAGLDYRVRDADGCLRARCRSDADATAICEAVNSLAAPRSAPTPERKLTKVARIGNTTYGVGVSESLVIERAYREQEWHLKPPMETDPAQLEKLREAIGSGTRPTEGEQKPVAWTYDVPSVEGWYWLRRDAGDVVVLVFKRPGHNYLCIDGDQYGPLHRRDFIPVQRIGAHCAWLGPITPSSAAPPSPPDEGATVRDALRYRWLRNRESNIKRVQDAVDVLLAGEELDAAIDAALRHD